MSNFANNFQQNAHQIAQTFAWSILLDIAIVLGALRYDKAAAITHLIFGWIILILTYTFVLYFLIPYGFNVGQVGTWTAYAHGIIGCMLLGFIALQIIGGIANRMLQRGKKTEIFLLKKFRMVHRIFGYFLAILYKINLLWAWFNTLTYVFIALMVWEVFWLATYLWIKFMMPDLQTKVTDVQTKDFVCTEVGRLSEVLKLTSNYVIFANYIYDARELE